MAKSMTGYGREDFSIGGDVFSIEVKSLNHRFIDVYLRMPDRFSPFENRVRDEIKKRFARGSFTVHLTPVSAESPALKLNLQMARLYVETAEELERELGVKGNLDATVLLRLKDIFSVERKAPVSEVDWEPLKKALHSALGHVEEWRKREGAHLREDILSKLQAVETLVSRIEARAPKVLEAYRQRLKDEIEKVVGERVDYSRILTEAAVFAERTDVNEEIARLKSHLDMFRKFFKFDEPIGKRLDFLCQEIGRETNTIGSKPSDVEITQTVVEMKGEIEKIREQVQNVE